MNNLLCSIVGTIAISASLSYAATPRSWSSSDGSHSFVASLDAVYDSVVDLNQPAVGSLRIPMPMFCEKDQAFLKLVRATSFKIGTFGTVSAPSQGYAWRMQSNELYLCQRRGHTSAIKLSVRDAPMKDPVKRRALLKDLLLTIEEIPGTSQMVKTLPDPNAEFQDVINYEVAWTPPENRFLASLKPPCSVVGRVIFTKRRVFVFEAMSPSVEEGRMLLSVTQTLIEK